MLNSGSNKRRHFRLDSRGVAALKFAMVGALFFIVFFAAIEVSRYFLTMHSLRTVAAEAARAAMVNSTLSGCGDNVAAAAGGLGFLGPNATLCINRTVPSQGTTQIAVTAQAPYRLLVSVFGAHTLTLSESQTFSFRS